ncbi:MAG: hypothetical protein L3J54_07710 [Draconibacterium sp.]|nr:hypothetical protein [Draconibacterium sp.]
MIKEFHFSFDELNIIPKDLIDLLGFEDGVVPEPFPKIIEQALLEASQFCSITGGYKILESVEINQKNATIKIETEIFSPSKIVTTQLKESTSVALYICTAGEEISNRANEILTQGDPMLGYIFDVIGSVTVEKATDKMQKLLEIEVKKHGLNISDRYSPGYCEWSVAEQQKLFSFFPHNFCGVSLSKSSLMSPIKSVSGIIGIGIDLKQKGYQCRWCNDENCIYGKIKQQKNSSKAN